MIRKEIEGAAPGSAVLSLTTFALNVCVTKKCFTFGITGSTLRTFVKTFGANAIVRHKRMRSTGPSHCDLNIWHYSCSSFRIFLKYFL